MEHALTEMPLALFTTFAPMSAGAFIAVVVALFSADLSDKQLKLLDKLTIIPLILLAAAFIAAFFHLANPLNALNAFSGIGRSPMTNEIVAGVIFGLLLLVYCIIGLVGKFSVGARKGFAVLVALVGLVFAFFIGMAYMIPTIVSWNTPLVPISICGFTLLGGTLCGTTMLAGAGALDAARSSAFKPVMLIVALIGLVACAIAVWAHFFMVAGIETAAVSGAELTSGLVLYLVICSLCAVVAFACECIALFKSNSVAVLVIGVIFMLAATLVARLVFYAMQISIGI